MCSSFAGVHTGLVATQLFARQESRSFEVRVTEVSAGSFELEALASAGSLSPMKPRSNWCMCDCSDDMSYEETMPEHRLSIHIGCFSKIDSSTSCWMMYVEQYESATAVRVRL